MIHIFPSKAENSEKEQQLANITEGMYNM